MSLLHISFGVIKDGGCGEILYPNTIRDLIDFSLRECVRWEIPVRRCRSCGRYFLITGRITAEYCSRLSASRKLCRSTAPVQKWAESRGRVQGMVKKSARIIPKRGRSRRDRPRVLFQRDQKHLR
ncbi:DUF6076 domain-containing protein [uncultured Oscillibacter sp.]|uniref:DUF6076 domain-containing protein n=1 Tax=uncultured Oscillibacter sp. TaxID=876091 RepID=UPI00261F0CD3|nr:DUF6076 domain-containing protein [uncultured Oscillibacter sp.]